MGPRNRSNHYESNVHERGFGSVHVDSIGRIGTQPIGRVSGAGIDLYSGENASAGINISAPLAELVGRAGAWDNPAFHPQDIELLSVGARTFGVGGNASVSYVRGGGIELNVGLGIVANGEITIRLERLLDIGTWGADYNGFIALDSQGGFGALGMGVGAGYEARYDEGEGTLAGYADFALAGVSGKATLFSISDSRTVASPVGGPGYVTGTGMGSYAIAYSGQPVGSTDPGWVTGEGIGPYDRAYFSAGTGPSTMTSGPSLGRAPTPDAYPSVPTTDFHPAVSSVPALSYAAPADVLPSVPTSGLVPVALTFGLPSVATTGWDHIGYSVGIPAVAGVQADWSSPYAPTSSPRPVPRPESTYREDGFFLETWRGRAIDPDINYTEAALNGYGHIGRSGSPTMSFGASLRSLLDHLGFDGEFGTQGSFSRPSDRQDAPQGDDRSDKPILLDLNGNGIEISEVGESTRFMDANGDGLRGRSAWAGAGDAVLFYDPDGRNAITEARQYIFSEWDPTAGSDVEALRAVFDTNGDGKLTAADADFAKFKLMVTNADGSTSVMTLASLGIVEMESGDESKGPAFPIGLPVGTTGGAWLCGAL